VLGLVDPNRVHSRIGYSTLQPEHSCKRLGKIESSPRPRLTGESHSRSLNSLTNSCPYLPYIRMTTATAKVFKSGNSQAVRLPKAFRLSSKTVTLVKTTDGFTVSDPTAHARRLKAFLALAGSCPDFPEIPANDAPNFRRDWE